jgi:hypothetical protein
LDKRFLAFLHQDFGLQKKKQINKIKAQHDQATTLCSIEWLVSDEG